MRVQEAKSPAQENLASNCEQSFHPTLDLGGVFTSMGADSVAVLFAGVAANSARYKGLEQYNKISERRGAPRADNCLACA